jgi:redox-sensitive bicupin YhaK (pirin superfamily)
MSAGTGIQHSEWNYGEEPVRLQQIWFLPGPRGLQPSYAQDHYTVTASGLTVVASPWGAAGGVPIYQDVLMALAERPDGAPFEYELSEGRGLYLYAVDGENTVDGEELRRGDAARVAGNERLTLGGSGHLLIIDLPVAARAARSRLMEKSATPQS